MSAIQWKSDCRLFTGFSPCRYRRSCAGCPHFDPVEERILVIQLDALGDVLRTTAMLPAIRRTWRNAHVTWLTRRDAAPLLANNPLVDRILVLGEDTTAVLGALEFDVALCPEKSIPAGALMCAARAPDKRGFAIDDAGNIAPLTEAAHELYGQGLDNEAKFFLNTKSTQHLASESVGLPYRHDRYIIVMDDVERGQAREDRRIAGVGDDEILVGWNTGCGPRYPYKRLEIDDQVALMLKAWSRIPRRDRVRFALLGGGADDQSRNARIAAELATKRIPVIETPCGRGLRRGIASVAACDMVVSGDTLALHLAIAQRKPVVAWFTITCHQEIDVYGRGIKVLADVPCRPCWLQSCSLDTKCYRTLPWTELADSVAEMADTLLRDGSWTGERLVGEFPRVDRVSPPLGVSPGPVVRLP